jgi:sugar phosphate isomerase/epimerase
MRTGLITTALLDRSLTAALDFVCTLGVETVEIPAAGGFWPAQHCDPVALMADPAAADAFGEEFRSRGLEVSALALHGNPVDPDTGRAALYREQFQAACHLAERLGITRITLLAGLPGAGPRDEFPNWIVFPFPSDMTRALQWQWEERLLPYWESAAPVARDSGVRLCFEMVPNDLVYTPDTLLRLRAEIGDVVGANLDPSHFMVQGLDEVTAIEVLGEAIYHVHAKDVAFNQRALRRKGALDMAPLGDVSARSWSYRTMGWGHDQTFWADFITALRLSGYDDVVSVEHEDAALSAEEGLRLGVEFISRIVPSEPITGDLFIAR